MAWIMVMRTCAMKTKKNAMKLKELSVLKGADGGRKGEKMAGGGNSNLSQMSNLQALFTGL